MDDHLTAQHTRFMHDMMLRALELRRAHQPMPQMSGLISSLGDLQHALEAGDPERIRDTAIDLSAVALRVGVEFKPLPIITTQFAS